MERNTFLAILFSIVVLFIYQAVFVPPKPAHPLLNSQAIENKQNIEIDQKFVQKPSQITRYSTNTVNKTDDFVISNQESKFLFTNMGGSLHNIKIIKNNPIPLTDLFNLKNYEDVLYSGEKIDNKNLIFRYKNSQSEIIKSFQLVDAHKINVRMEIKNISQISNLEIPNITGFMIDDSNLIPNNRENVLLEYSVYYENKIFRRSNAIKFNEKNDKSEFVPLKWIGFRDHYNAIIIKPEFETKGYEIKEESEKELKVSVLPKEAELRPGETAVFNFTMYVGPQDVWLMKKYDPQFPKIVAFSNFAVVEWISKGIYYLIPFFHHIFRSWGLGIILISLMIYGLTYPLTLKSMMSMRKMQEVQPKINALRERYKEDPQKLNMEMVEIYRREKINPFGGCLPFLIQMPFFMALYQVLWRAQYFQGQGFLWIKDLSQPDRLLTLPFYLPILGNEFNILPVLTGCMMFLQQKVSSKNMIVVDEQQVMQQRMMMFILPIMMTVMFYKFASSWAIYFLVFYTLSTFSQWKIAQISKK